MLRPITRQSTLHVMHAARDHPLRLSIMPQQDARASSSPLHPTKPTHCLAPCRPTCRCKKIATIAGDLNRKTHLRSSCTRLRIDPVRPASAERHLYDPYSRVCVTIELSRDELTSVVLWVCVCHTHTRSPTMEHAQHVHALTTRTLVFLCAGHELRILECGKAGPASV